MIEEPHRGGLGPLGLLSHDTLHIRVPYTESSVQILRAFFVIMIESEGLLICCRYLGCLVLTDHMLSLVFKHFVIMVY
jgi:hypothetical protein